MLKCPKCGSTNVEYDDYYDMSTFGDTVIQYWSGHCMECNVNLCWKEIFEFKETINIVVDD